MDSPVGGYVHSERVDPNKSHMDPCCEFKSLGVVWLEVGFAKVFL